MSMSLTYSTEEREAVIKTTRAAGAVGRFPLVYRMFRERFKRTDIKVLDYGSGVDVPHARELEREGWTVEAMDLGLPEWINDVARERGPFDVVLCSNVLNVQPNLALVISVLYDLRSLIAEGGSSTTRPARGKPTSSWPTFGPRFWKSSGAAKAPTTTGSKTGSPTTSASSW